MKQLLEDYLGKTVYKWKWTQTIETETKGGDYGSSTYIESESFEPRIEVSVNKTCDWDYEYVNLTDLLVFIYNNKK